MDGIHSRLFSQRAQPNYALNGVVEDGKVGFGIQISGVVYKYAVWLLVMLDEIRGFFRVGKRASFGL